MIEHEPIVPAVHCRECGATPGKPCTAGCLHAQPAIFYDQDGKPFLMGSAAWRERAAAVSKRFSGPNDPAERA